MENKNYKILGVLFLSEFAIMALVFFLVLFLFMFNVGIVARGTDEREFFPVFLTYGIIFLIYILFMLPFGVGGYKLFNNKSGAKGWGIAASVCSLFFFFPLGIIISILGFVFLFSNDEKPRGQYQNQNPQNFNPPNPPQNWH